MSDIQLYHGDCLEVLKHIPEGSVDMLLTDPPFNISQNAKSLDRSRFKSKKMKRSAAVTLDYGEWDKQGRGDFISFTRTWFGECARALKPGGAVISFFSAQDISLLAWIGEDFDVRFRTFFTWIKTNPMPSIYRKNNLSATESIFIGSKGSDGWTFNFTRQEEMHNVFSYPNKSVYGETEHLCEKPVALLNHFIKVHTNEGDVVLDAFMGTGATGVSCIDLGRRFIGIEKDAQWFGVAKARIERRKKQGIQGELF